MSQQFELPVTMGDYDTILTVCESLDVELKQSVSLARKLHFLSLNAACAIARTGSDRAAFQVLSQEVEPLNKAISVCISETQFLVDNLVKICANLIFFLSRSDFVDEIGASIDFVNEQNNRLGQLLSRLSQAFSPMENLIRKGEYLAVFSALEAASSAEHRLSFELISSNLGTLIADFKGQSKLQMDLIIAVTDSVEKQRRVLRAAVKAA